MTKNNPAAPTDTPHAAGEAFATPQPHGISPAQISGIKTSIIRMTKMLANYYLGFNIEPQPGVEDSNRKSSIAAAVEPYTQAMVAGKWPITHQGIALSVPDPKNRNRPRLQDGAQRLKAFLAAIVREPRIETDPDDGAYAVWMMVTEGLPLESANSMDLGRRRVQFQFLEMKGIPNARLVSTVGNMVNVYYNVPWTGGYSAWRKAKLVPADLQVFVKENPLLQKSAKFKGGVFGIAGTFNVDSAAAGWVLLAAEHGEEVADAFMEALIKGHNQDDSSPPFVLREFFRTSQKNKRKMDRFELLALLIKSFNAWIVGTTWRVYFRTDEPFPKVLPKAELPSGRTVVESKKKTTDDETLAGI